MVLPHCIGARSATSFASSGVGSSSSSGSQPKAKRSPALSLGTTGRGLSTSSSASSCSQVPPLARKSSAPLSGPGQTPIRTSEAPARLSKPPRRRAALATSRRPRSLSLQSNSTKHCRSLIRSGRKSASSSGFPVRLPSASLAFGDPFQMPLSATAGTPALSRAAAFLAPSVITRGSLFSCSHHFQKSPLKPVRSVSTSAGTAPIPQRSITRTATSGGTRSQNERVSVSCGTSYLISDPSRVVRGASGLKHPQSIGLHFLSGSRPAHHQPPASATASRGLSSRRTAAVAYWEAWPPN